MRSPIGHRGITAGKQYDAGQSAVAVPGVTQDSAASGELLVRNEHANLQYRINGIMLPYASALSANPRHAIIGSLALLTGRCRRNMASARPVCWTIQTKADAFNNSGSVSVYGGSHGTITPTFSIWRHRDLLRRCAHECLRRVAFSILDRSFDEPADRRRRKIFFYPSTCRHIRNLRDRAVAAGHRRDTAGVLKASALVWMSSTPAVRWPYCAGSAPVSSARLPMMPVSRFARKRRRRRAA